MHRFTACSLLVLTSASAAAQTAPDAAASSPLAIETSVTTFGTETMVGASIRTLPDEPVALFASWTGSSSPYTLVATGIADPTGALLFTAPLKPDLLPADAELVLTAAMLDGGVIQLAESGVAFGSASGCETLDFDFAIGQQDPVKGEPIALQWAEAGVFIATFNEVPGHPDLGITFDSSNPSGGDPDLATPGPGLGNDTALGNLMIIAENAVDSDGDGLIDDPDDEMGGGVIRFNFQNPWELCSITLVDIDDPDGTELRFYTDILGAPDVIPVMNVGDNSVQQIHFMKSDVVRFEVAFGGSGGIAQLDAVPCPRIINFDERTLGAPLDLKTGETITDQFADLGVHIEGNNNVAGHPDKAILFDSENPTGGDTDLATPGPGAGNDTPLGKVLILAENDVDADMDGLVDDPDDEEGGGNIQFRFDAPVDFIGASILDVDGTEFDAFNLYDANDNLILFVPIPSMGDNSVQTLVLNPPISGVSRAELILAGSGAVTDLKFCPTE